MTPELHMLLCAVLLGLVHLLISAVAGSRQFGMKYALGPRDEQIPLTGIPARLNRAYGNFMATFPFFAALVLSAHLAGIHSTLTVLACQLYFWMRLIYIPLYAFAIPVARTPVWFASLAGILLLLYAQLVN